MGDLDRTLLTNVLAKREGRLIAIEGIDGAGKSTIVEALREALTGRGWSKIITPHEPRYEGAIGKVIRSALDRDISLDPHALALLYAADRADNTRGFIAPAVLNGTMVLMDRYVLSSYAYQSLHCPPDWLVQINALAIWPDATYVIDLDVDVALSRLASLEDGDQLFNKRETLTALRGRYLALAKRHACNVVNGDQPTSDIVASIVADLERRELL